MALMVAQVVRRWTATAVVAWQRVWHIGDPRTIGQTGLKIGREFRA